jgi:hypothetical protein
MFGLKILKFTPWINIFSSSFFQTWRTLCTHYKKSMSIWEKQDPTLVCCNYISLIRIKDVPPMFRGWNFYFKKKTIFNLGSKKNVNIKKIKYLTLSKDKMFRHIKKIIVYKLHFRFFLTHESYFWIMDIRPSSKVLYTLIIHMNLYFSNWCKKLG